jgi:hypothetical protein
MDTWIGQTVLDSNPPSKDGVYGNILEKRTPQYKSHFWAKFTLFQSTVFPE